MLRLPSRIRSSVITDYFEEMCHGKQYVVAYIDGELYIYIYAINSECNKNPSALHLMTVVTSEKRIVNYLSATSTRTELLFNCVCESFIKISTLVIFINDGNLIMYREFSCQERKTVCVFE